LTETPEEPERDVDDPGGAPESAGPEDAPAVESAPVADGGQSEAQVPRADSSSEAQDEEAVTEDAIVEQPAEEAAEVSAEPAAAEVAAEATTAEVSAEATMAPPSAEEAEGEEEIEVVPRIKPEIPGADLEPDLLADAEQYLDAEAQAAAEAEAEAAAERARAEAEDEQVRPIADAAIDLAAGARYTATGKRKTAVARVILKPGNGEYSINGKSLATFFPRETLQRMIRQPLETVGYEARMDVVARMHGGGTSAQAGALRHGISRALIVADPNLRGELKRRGYLTRDPRVKERKKAGLKKARKRPQFSKR
jgi:small subunit ribosomal protein S9